MTEQVGRPDQFFRAGVQHYVSARQAFLNGYETAGGLFHQGFELILKADLLDDLYQRHGPGWAPPHTDAERTAAVHGYNAEARALLKDQIGHRLRIAWALFKGRHPSQGLDSFDAVIEGLDGWWQLRYPGFPTSRGLTLGMSATKVAEPIVTAAVGPPAENYQLVLEEMDELFAAVAPLPWSLHAIQLAVGGRRVGPNPGWSAYLADNRHPLWTT